jgi:asparagine synthase (glutamine-hydrolysing)
MCGIFGLFGRPLAPRAEADALQALAHRGPDGSQSLHLRPDAVIGHTRLAIIDLDGRADQPMTGLDGRLAIVFNGEIYNAPSLRAEIADYPWTTDHSDTETVLAAYWRWGKDFLTHLRGMFAFALWDAAAERLLLAVDRFGIKPLLYARRGDSLAFGSNAAALGALGVPLAPNERAVHSWLADGVTDTGPETFFAGINQLTAATLAVWHNGDMCFDRYWEPPSPDERPVDLDTIAGWLDEAVDSHLLSDVPVGVNLSSGLDSNLLRLRARAAGAPLHAYSFGFPDTPYDEPARVRPAMADGDAWTVTPITSSDLWHDLVDVTRMLEMPLGGVAIYGHYRNAAAAQAGGHKVLFAGEGADEIFGGYKYYAEAAVAQRWRAGDRAGAQALFHAFATRDPKEWRTTPECLAKAADQPAVARAPDGTVLAGGFLTESFAASAKLAPVPAPSWNVGDHPVRAAMWRDLAHTKLPKLLRWQDRTYMAHGVEIRVPFLDHVLVERLQSVPVEQLFAGGHTKAPLRQMAERLLPSDFFRQPKFYVATPQREWLKHDLRSRVEDWLDPGAALVRHGYIDLERLRRAYADYCADDALGNSFFIWKYIALESMFMSFFE